VSADLKVRCFWRTGIHVPPGGFSSKISPENIFFNWVGFLPAGGFFGSVMPGG
jgi:hypothetical protein